MNEHPEEPPIEMKPKVNPELVRKYR